jgi:predicted DCC family thiol-disulfide oxidoreductase YuxK
VRTNAVPVLTRSALDVAAHTVVFFDGACGVCDRLVRFAVARDGARRLLFAPLQGSSARSMLPPEVLAGDVLSTMVVLTENGELLDRSRAVAHVLRRLGGGWRVLGWAMAIVPTAVADTAYRWVARNRHRFFEPPACGVSSADERRRFLD